MMHSIVYFHKFPESYFQSLHIHYSSLILKAGYLLAPSGAQEMQMFVRLSVCLMKSVLEFSIFSFLSQVSLRSVVGLQSLLAWSLSQVSLSLLHQTDGA